MVAPERSLQRFAFEPDYVTEPGEILLKTIEALGITRQELATHTGHSVEGIDLLIRGCDRISAEIALQLSSSTGVPSRFWCNLETQFQKRKTRLTNR